MKERLGRGTATDRDADWAAPKFAATIAVTVAATGATMTYFAPHPPPAAPAPNVTINIPSQPAQEPPPDPCRCPAGIDPGSKPMTPPDAEMSWQERASGVNDFLTRVEALREEYDTIKPTRCVIGADDGPARATMYYHEKRVRSRALVKRMLALQAKLDEKYPQRWSRHAAPAPAPAPVPALEPTAEPITLPPERTRP